MFYILSQESRAESFQSWSTGKPATGKPRNKGQRRKLWKEGKAARLAYQPALAVTDKSPDQDEPVGGTSSASGIERPEASDHEKSSLPAPFTPPATPPATQPGTKGPAPRPPVVENPDDSSDSADDYHVSSVGPSNADPGKKWDSGSPGKVSQKCIQTYIAYMQAQIAKALKTKPQMSLGFDVFPTVSHPENHTTQALRPNIHQVKREHGIKQEPVGDVLTQASTAVWPMARLFSHSIPLQTSCFSYFLFIIVNAGD